jgi:hypothetical protein
MAVVNSPVVKDWVLASTDAAEIRAAAKDPERDRQKDREREALLELADKKVEVSVEFIQALL